MDRTDLWNGGRQWWYFNVLPSSIYNNVRIFYNAADDLTTICDASFDCGL